MLVPDSESEAFTAVYKESVESAVAASIARADARSVCLKIVASVLLTCSALALESLSFRSPNTSPRLRMLPSASYACNPSSLNMFAALSLRGICRDMIMFRRCVPPSEALMPLSAKMPSDALNSVVPPASPCAVPPTVRIASPSCATDVFDLLAVMARLSANAFRLVCVASMFRADIASVTISLASPNSIAPAPASLKTVGSAAAAFSASYPASAR